MSEDSGDTVARVDTGSNIIAVKTPPRHWTSSLPLWGIFGALVAGVAFAATLAADVRNLTSTVGTWNAATVERLKALEANAQALDRWRAVVDAQQAAQAAAAARGGRR